MMDDHKRKRITGIPKFLRSLYRMLESEDPTVISWSKDGSAIQIHSERRLEAEVLRKYFNHEKASSFQRQLNNFGFRKWTKTQSHLCTFSHPFFLRQRPDLLPQVVRKSPRSTPTASENNQENQPQNQLFYAPGVFTFDVPNIHMELKHEPQNDTFWDDMFPEEDCSNVCIANNVTLPWLPEDKSNLLDGADFDMSFLLDDAPMCLP